MSFPGETYDKLWVGILSSVYSNAHIKPDSRSPGMSAVDK